MKTRIVNILRMPVDREYFISEDFLSYLLMRDLKTNLRRVFQSPWSSSCLVSLVWVWVSPFRVRVSLPLVEFCIISSIADITVMLVRLDNSIGRYFRRWKINTQINADEGTNEWENKS